MASLDADAMLEASLDRLKRTNSAYLNDQNPRTAQHFVAAMDGQSKALTSARMFKQAEQMNKAKVDFQNSGPSMRMKIAYSLAKSLRKMIVKNLREWCLGGSVSGVAYMLYDVHANGETLSSTDTDGDGLLDTHAIDTNNDQIPDYETRDTDGNGDIDAVHTVSEGPEGELEVDPDAVGEGGFFEAIFAFVGWLAGSDE